MYVPDFAEFCRLAEKGNLVPVYREIIADLDTPVSAFLKLRTDAEGGACCLLESVTGGENVARFSYIAVEPRLTIATKDRNVLMHPADGSPQESLLALSQDPLDVLKEILSRYQYVPLPGWRRFPGGLVGYMAYDLVRFFEELPAEKPDDLGLPDIQFMLADTLVVFDHVLHRVRVVANAHVHGDPQQAYWEAIDRIERIIDKLSRPLPERPKRNGTRPARVPDDPAALPSTMTRAQHREAVLRAKEYVAAGDVIQVVLSHRMSVQIDVDPFDIYRALRAVNPSPYMFYLSFGDTRLIGASPEILVTEENGNVVTRPIAGTRRRGRDEKEDELLAQELLADAKERAEHIMLVDLHRNDIGRVCVPGTVRVAPDELMFIERYSHVMHIVSNVTGRLREDRDQFDLLRAVFPAGTVTGAPKIRAMEIIEELEPVRRGPYAGAVGYFGFSGAMDTCITLRTVVMKGDTAYLQAGGGIVADSDPDAEYQETLNKLAAILEAVRMADRGLV
ncbi:MAG: anthranilate synthase component I [Armatimonadetes bacterium]|nr:anthranilate synthase component I [Armatimonadota bacterium]